MFLLIFVHLLTLIGSFSCSLMKTHIINVYLYEAKPIFHTKNYIEVYPNILIYLQIVFLFIEYVTFAEYMYFFLLNSFLSDLH